MARDFNWIILGFMDCPVSVYIWSETVLSSRLADDVRMTLGWSFYPSERIFQLGSNYQQLTGDLFWVRDRNGQGGSDGNGGTTLRCQVVVEVDG